MFTKSVFARALALGASVVTAGCGLDGLFGADGARVRIALSRDGGAVANMVMDSVAVLADRDKDESGHGRGRDFLRFQAATLTLSSVLVRTLDGELVDLDVDLPIDVDVVRIDGGRQLVLPDGFLPFGTYDQVVFVITAVRGVLRDGTIVTIEPAGGGWTTVVPICPLEIFDGEPTTIGIAFNVRNSFVQLGNWWSFQPRFRSLVDCDDDDNDA
jgi:hypothetical protein